MSSSEDPYRLDLLGGVASLPTEKEAAEIATLEALLPVVAPMLGPEHLIKHINVSTKINGGCVLPGLQKAIEVATATIPDFNFWEKTLPRIIAATRTIPALFPEGCIRILPKNKLCSDNGDTTDGGGGTVVAGPLFRTSTSFTRDQIFALLAASFLHRLPYGKDKDTFGSITWLSLMTRSSSVGAHRLACLMCYFHTYNPHGSDAYHGEEKVVFERVSGNGGGKTMSVKSLLQLTTTPVIPKATMDATSNIVGTMTMTITSKIRIEDVELADAIVDFANKQPSIGEIIPSATQEEVLFSIKPESMLSMVIFEELEPAEVGIVYGSQRYCNYTGYMDTFRFHSPYPPLKDGGGAPAAMIVMDAMVNRGKAEVRDEWFERDLMKAYLGFSSIRCIPRRGSGSGSVEQTTARPLIVTGGWGCGMFGCNQGLKFLQQAIVASLAGVRLVYTTFGSDERAARFTRMAATLEARGTSVAEAMGWVQEFARDGNLRHDQFEDFLAAKLK